MPPKGRKSVVLEAPRVFVRLRPAASSGGHAQHGHPPSSKQIHNYDDRSITIGWASGGCEDIGHALAAGEGQRYEYMDQVLRPEISQDDVFRTVAAPLVDTVLGAGGRAPKDAMLFCYGQTGTGKTFTLLGPDASISATPPGEAVDERWGCLPRLVYELWGRLSAGPEAAPFVMTVAAAEFYLMQSFDLLDGGAPATVTQQDARGAALTGIKRVQLRVKARHTRSTLMNLSKAKGDDDEHGGSSRGHAAFLISVSRLVDGSAKGDGSSSDAGKARWVQTTFNVVDLAGAERPDKTGAGRCSPMEAAMEVYQAVKASRPVAIKAQTFFINYELFTLMDAVLMATAANKANPTAGYQPPAMILSDGMRYMGTCFSDAAEMAVVVTLSQAPQCGWETWFSCNYGMNLAKLRYLPRPAVPAKVGATLKEMRATIREHRSKLDAGAGRGTKYEMFRRAGIIDCEHRLVVLRELCPAVE